MPIALVDCFSGAAGDMWVGALLDLGLPLEELSARIGSLGLAGVAVRSERVMRGSLSGTHFVVDVASRTPVLDLGGLVGGLVGGPAPRRPAAAVQSHGPHRGLAEIEAILARADLPGGVRERCRAVFQCIAQAEAKVHGSTLEKVHFHEVGAEDTIVDVVCAVLGTELLGIERIHAGEVVVGSGTVRCEHGTLPVPAPGTLEILKGIPIRAGELAGERTTPTGAALLKVLVHEFARPVRCVPMRVGYGAGTRDTKDVPNLLRITLAEPSDPGASTRIVEVACNLDTASGELLAFLIEGCLARGALDAFAVPATMKKGRPAFVLHAVCDHALRDRVAGFLLEESSTLGVRMLEAERRVLERWGETRETTLGPVRMKCARLPSGAVMARPEDDEVNRLVREQGLARREVLARLDRGFGGE